MDILAYDGELVTRVLDAIKLVTSDDAFAVAVRVAAIVGALFAVMRSNVSGSAFVPFALSVITYLIFFETDFDVTVEDIHTGETAIVDDVPFAVAGLASFSSQAAYGFSEIFETGFSLPGCGTSSGVTSEGYGGHAETLKRVMISGGSVYDNNNIRGSGAEPAEFATAFRNYAAFCAVPAMEMQNDLASDVRNATDFFGALDFGLTTNACEIRRANGATDEVICDECYEILGPALDSFIDAYNEDYLAPVLNVGSGAAAENRVTEALCGLGINGSGRELIETSLLGPLWYEANRDRAELDLSFTYARQIDDALRARLSQWTSQASVFHAAVPWILAMGEALIYALGPLVGLIMLATGNPMGAISHWVKFGMILLVFPIGLAITQFFVDTTIAGDLSALDGSGETITSLTGFFSASSVLQQGLGFASLLAASVPAIATAIVYGGSYSVNQLMGGLNSGDHVNEKMSAPSSSNAPVQTQLADGEQLAPMSIQLKSGAESNLGFVNMREGLAQSRSDAQKLVTGAGNDFLAAASTAVRNSQMVADGGSSGLRFTDTTGTQSSLQANWQQKDAMSVVSHALEGQGVSRQVQQQVAKAIAWNAGLAVEANLALAKTGKSGLGPSGGIGGSIGAQASLRSELNNISGLTDEQRQSVMNSIESADAYAKLSADERRNSLLAETSRGEDSMFRTDQSVSGDATFQEAAKRYQNASEEYTETLSASKSFGLEQRIPMQNVVGAVSRNAAAQEALNLELAGNGGLKAADQFFNSQYKGGNNEYGIVNEEDFRTFSKLATLSGQNQFWDQDKNESADSDYVGMARVMGVAFGSVDPSSSGSPMTGATGVHQEQFGRIMSRGMQAEGEVLDQNGAQPDFIRQGDGGAVRDSYAGRAASGAGERADMRQQIVSAYDGIEQTHADRAVEGLEAYRQSLRDGRSDTVQQMNGAMGLPADASASDRAEASMPVPDRGLVPDGVWTPGVATDPMAVGQDQYFETNYQRSWSEASRAADKVLEEPALRTQLSALSDDQRAEFRTGVVNGIMSQNDVVFDGEARSQAVSRAESVLERTGSDGVLYQEGLKFGSEGVNMRITDVSVEDMPRIDDGGFSRNIEHVEKRIDELQTERMSGRMGEDEVPQSDLNR